ncbi:MAG: S41 family peptidase [Planctomycetota bacterium]
MLIPLAALVLTAPPAPAMQVGKDKAEAMLIEADRLPLDQAWEFLTRLQDLDVPEDTLLKTLREVPEKLGPVGKLLAAQALLNLDEDGTQSRRAVELALPLVDVSQDKKVRRAAIELMGNPGLGPTARRDAREGLMKLLKDDTEDQEVRLEAARSLYFVGAAEQIDYARRVLLDFLRSRDRDLKISGALALAEIGDMISARAVLEEIEDEPSARGHLARTYLRLERKEAEHERVIRRLLQNQLRKGLGHGQQGRFDLLEKLLALIERYHMEGASLDEDHLVESAAKGMMKALDRFSSFMTSDEYRRFTFDLGREYGGIGAFVNNDDGQFQITRPIYSGPAYSAGLMSGDRILEVDGWATHEQELDEIIRRLKGRPGTPVVIKVWRAGWTEPKDISLDRAMIQVPSVNSLMLPGDIGYAEIITFGSHTSQELEAQLRTLQAKGAKAFVLDLRGNSGGFLSQAQRICNLFLPKGKVVVTTKSTIGDDERYACERDPAFADTPVVVLVDARSASASEIVSGCLQDHHRARIVGNQTYGKGSVQNLFEVPDYPPERFEDLNGNRHWDEGEPYFDDNKNGEYDPGPRARVTISYYFLPSGRKLHKLLDKDGKPRNPDYGVMPDVEADFDRLDAKELWKNAVIAEMLGEGVFKKYVDEHLNSASKEQFLELALSDGGDTGRYPGFDEFYKGLDTKLSKDDVRKWIRIRIREKVADFRGQAWPGGRLYGDYQEDVQLQAAIAEALRLLDRDAQAVAEYKGIWKYTPKKKGEKVGKR